jgi:hypothetical protein
MDVGSNDVTMTIGSQWMFPGHAKNTGSKDVTVTICSHVMFPDSLNQVIYL